jgi:hypothetical protein
LSPTGSAPDIPYAPLRPRPATRLCPLPRRRGGPRGSQRGQGKSDLPWPPVNARLTLTRRARRSIERTERAGGPPHRQPWAQSLEKHTKADIRADLQHQHRQLCRQYKNAASASESETRYLAIRARWLSSRATSEEGLSRLELWLAFWHFRYCQWGGFMQLVSFLLFISLHVTLSTLLEFMALHFSI